MRTRARSNKLKNLLQKSDAGVAKDLGINEVTLTAAKTIERAAPPEVIAQFTSQERSHVPSRIQCRSIGLSVFRTLSLAGAGTCCAVQCSRSSAAAWELRSMPAQPSPMVLRPMAGRGGGLSTPSQLLLAALLAADPRPRGWRYWHMGHVINRNTLEGDRAAARYRGQGRFADVGNWHISPVRVINRLFRC